MQTTPDSFSLRNVLALAQRVSIAIPTRDRWDDLATTLTRLHEQGYSVLETAVADDGSVEPMPAGFAERFPWVQFVRSEQPQNVCVQRNRLMRLLTRPLVLNLDDDSFPVAGDLAAACDWIESHPSVTALSFQIIFRNQPPWDEFTAREPFPLRDFIGCAALLKREPLLAVGGYEEKFEFYLEEPDLCLRALQAGQETWAYPAFIVQHNVSAVRRLRGSRARMLLRKEVLLALIYFPFPWSLRRLLTAVPGFLYHNAEHRPYWRFMILGAFQGLGDYLSGRYPRRRLTLPQFRAWLKVPIAPQVMMRLKSAPAPAP